MANIRLGRRDAGGYLEFPVSQLRETHWAVSGRTGQRKSLFLLSLLTQYIKLKHHSVVFVDLGGDQAGFAILRAAAQAAGKPFYFFSLGKHDSASWDPIRNTPAFRDDRTAAANGIAQGLRLEHSDGYGRTYWSRMNFNDINRALDNLAAQGNSLPTFREFSLELREMSSLSRSSQNVSEAYLAAEQLLRYPALAEKRATELFLGGAIDEGAVVVFYLPTAIQGGAARSVASLASWCTTVEAAYRAERGMDERVVHLAIDEFPQIAVGRGVVASTLTMARKWNLQAYLIYQDRDQLRTADGDLCSTLWSQCQQIVFTADSEDEQNQLRLQSKDILRSLKSDSVRQFSASTSNREYWDAALTRNEILERSGIAMAAFAILKLGDRYRDPIPFTVIPPTSREQHRMLSKTPIPPAIEPTRVVSELSHDRSPREKRSAGNPKTEKAIHELIDAIKQEEVWEIET